MRIGFVIEGAAELDRNLATLGSRIERSVIRRAVREAQQPMLKAAQANARALHRGSGGLFAAGEDDLSMSELLARNIVIAAPKRQIRHSYSLHVQMRRDVPEFVHAAKGARSIVGFNRDGSVRRGRTIGVTYIPAAIEYGHGSSKEKAARPFMRPAADSTRNEVMARLARELGNGILREAIRGRHAT